MTTPTPYDRRQAVFAGWERGDAAFAWPTEILRTEQQIQLWAQAESQRIATRQRRRRRFVARLARAVLKEMAALSLLGAGIGLFGWGCSMAHCSVVQAFSLSRPESTAAQVLFLLGSLLSVLGTVATMVCTVALLLGATEGKSRSVVRPSAPGTVRYEVKAVTDSSGNAFAEVLRHLPGASTRHSISHIAIGRSDDDSATIAERFNEIVSAAEAQQRRADDYRQKVLAAHRLDDASFDATVHAALQAELHKHEAAEVNDALTARLTALAAERLTQT